ncbi:MAG: MBOAT family protein [Oscillospiraceae bacterium]|nr:MBOAT family protein [Oscillospiraceae bacterium]MBR4656913.1 MBOAT family protein [Oscillospiraceae bacterium]
MAFSSPAFVFVFLPAVFLLYRLIPWHKGKNLLLLLFSLIFYSAGSLVHLPLLLGVALVNYLAGLWFRGRRQGNRVVLILTLILNLGALAAFKYLDFFAGTLNDVFGFGLPLPGLALPIGISFFTFQGLSYAIDTYRDPDSGTRNFLEALLYLSFFPQLIAGPIVKYHDVAQQIRSRSTTAEDSALGLRRFLVGLSKKLLLADILALAVDEIYGQAAVSDVRLSALAMICYCLQIYFDFSGYSDMAIGMGRMFGFRFHENFNYPYCASSIREFWRRWHISLSSWFKEYVYIPLGGNRRGQARTCWNLLLVFFLTGLWHGANWTFVAWGLWHGFWSILERTTPLKKISGKAVGHAYTLLIVAMGFALFRADDFSQALRIIGGLFTGWGLDRNGTLLLRAAMTPKVWAALAVGCVAAPGLHKPLAAKLEQSTAARTLSYAACLLLFGLCCLRLASATFNPFIYFRF